MEEERVSVRMGAMKLRGVNACETMSEEDEVDQDTMTCFKGSGYPMTIVY